jgi:SPP1 gp7 family putative phage head morphogenesis protein
VSIADDFLVDATTRRAAFLQRYAGGVSIQAQSKLDDIIDDLLVIFGRASDDLKGTELTQVTGRVVTVLEQRFGEMEQELVDAVMDLARAEADFTVEMLEQAATTPIVGSHDNQLLPAVLRSGLSPDEGPEQLTIKQAIQGFSRAKSRRIISDINLGIAEGEPTRQIAKRVEFALQKEHKRHADTLARTVTNHAANQAKHQVFAENAGILEGYEWVSVLDMRTSLICGGRDGKVYQMGKGPLPPAHWNCRSTVVASIDEDFEEPSVEGFRPGSLKEKQQLNFGQWLKKQPPEFQDEMLGPTRAKLFRDGGLEIDRFRDETGHTYTLEQLKQLSPLAFQRAGIE